jgi:hypothetical protein
MSKQIDLTGQKFEKLTVISESLRTHNDIYWHCLCDCGSEKIVSGKHLRRGSIKSCGCYRRENSSLKAKTHGATNTRLYNIWRSMKQRCKNPANENIKNNYLNRGIVVCSEWHDFSTFQSWAFSNGYADNLTIDRIDNDKGYFPGNCRWATVIEQANNRRSNQTITLNGVTLTLAQWTKKMRFSKTLLNKRIFLYGWSPEKALTTPVRGKGAVSMEVL